MQTTLASGSHARAIQQAMASWQIASRVQRVISAAPMTILQAPGTEDSALRKTVQPLPHVNDLAQRQPSLQQR